MTEYMFMPLRRYADFSGRSRRKEYWLWAAFNIVVVFILYGIIIAAVAPAAYEAQMASQSGLQPGAPSVGLMAGTGIVGILLLLYALATIIPNLAVTVRRFHDQDKSGWFILLGLIPFVGGLILLVFMLMEGTRGPNRYGSDPKAADMEPPTAGIG